MRKIALALLLAASLASGCATGKPGESGGLLQHYSAAKKLARAEKLLAQGDPAGAAKLLHAICSDGAQPGVTDEALFRLALLSLKASVDRPLSGQGPRLLRRLKKEYPDSPWTAQAAPLVELINVTEELRHQNRSLTSANQSLVREIDDLNGNLERLKRLDLELERKAR